MMFNKFIGSVLLASTLAFSSNHNARACSFGPLDNIKVGSTLNQVFSAIYNSCGGEVTINRECGNYGCDKSEQQNGQQFNLCSEESSYSPKKCILIRNGSVVKNQIAQSPFLVFITQELFQQLRPKAARHLLGASPAGSR